MPVLPAWHGVFPRLKAVVVDCEGVSSCSPCPPGSFGLGGSQCFPCEPGCVAVAVTQRILCGNPWASIVRPLCGRKLQSEVCLFCCKRLHFLPRGWLFGVRLYCPLSMQADRPERFLDRKKFNTVHR